MEAEGMVDERGDRLAHVSLPGEGLGRSSSRRSRLRRAAADVVERDRAHQERLVLAPDEEERHRPPLLEIERCAQ
jgi:hypothetical protein